MQYQIQTRQKGAWQRWIGFKPDTDKALVDQTWANMQGRRVAARLVLIGDKLKVVATKPASH
jgi:hypothetical protein